ncbi:secreted protein [Rhodopirellula baltica WH47]|uniref:Secreted protein n=1 Tax=Rhodopirellula baltica WH47 TaxID=991778 RepID=F2AYL1_RHOBT|nr:secreted protein [Rhodopirellula baltica WH47]
MTFPATRWSLAGLLLLTLLSLSSVQAEKSHDGEESELQTFELRIVDL